VARVQPSSVDTGDVRSFGVSISIAGLIGAEGSVGEASVGVAVAIQLLLKAGL
jgi:hypothetical protein